MAETPVAVFPRWIVPVGIAFAMLSVVTGAFGAHALKARLDANALSIWETASRYQMYHGLALLMLAGLTNQVRMCGIRGSAAFFTAGTIIFSGSLYTLSLSGMKWLGAITPAGGTLLITGWLILFLNAFAFQRSCRLP